MTPPMLTHAPRLTAALFVVLLLVSCSVGPVHQKAREAPASKIEQHNDERKRIEAEEDADEAEIQRTTPDSGGASTAGPAKSAEPIETTTPPATPPPAYEIEEAPAAMPRDAPDDAPRPASTGEDSESDSGGWGFEGDTYEEPEKTAEDKAREDVERLVRRIGDYKSSQRRAVADENDNGGSRRCGQVCDLSEAICSSSRKICRIADGNPSEGYFGNRCRWSRKECNSADELCSRCGG